MGVFQQVGQFSGNPYSFTIAGDAPTEQEAARLSQILDQQESPYRQQYESMFGGIASVPQEAEEEDDEMAIRRGLRTGSQTVKSLFIIYITNTCNCFIKLIIIIILLL